MIGIELLVVCIIGILAAAGVVGYRSYAQNARQAVLQDSRAHLSRKIATDVFAVGDDVFAADNPLIVSGENCAQYVNRLAVILISFSWRRRW